MQMKFGKSRALVVIDVQEKYIRKYEESLLSRINKAIQAAESRQEYIIYVKNTKCLRRGKETDEFAEGLLVLSGFVFCKEQANAFECEDLAEFLHKNGIQEVDIIGIDGNSCIAASAVGAKRCGYDVSLLAECIGVCNASRFEKTKAMLEEKGILFNTINGFAK